MATDATELSWNGQRISMVFRKPEAPTKLVMMLHGGPGGSKDGPANLFVHLEERLAVGGCAICRFDFRGSGKSSGAFADVTLCSLKSDFIRVRDWCCDQVGAPLVVVGESLGATVAVMGQNQFRTPTVFLWPAIDLRATSFRDFMTEGALETLSKQGYLMEGDLRLSYQFIDECMTLDLWPKIDHFKGKYLIVHGEQDKDVPVSQSERLAFKLGPRGDFISLANAGHGAKEPNMQEIVLNRVTNWILNCE